MWVAVLVNFLMLAPQLSVAFLVLNSLLLIIFMQGFRYPILKSRRLVNVFTVVGALLLIILSKQLGLMLTMVNLLVFSHVMKLFEQNHQRDFYVFNLLSLMVLATAMIFHQSLWFFLLFMVLLIISLLPLLNYQRQTTSVGNQQRWPSFTGVKPYIGLLTKLLTVSIPLAIFLFFIFPRLQPFAAIPQAKMAKTGLSDSVNVGDISQLVQSNELAFQVEFASPRSSHQPLYWRALVMEHFDGSTWQSAEHSPRLRAIFRTKQHYLEYIESQEPQPLFTGNAINYQVFVQPNYQQFLFALDVARPQSTAIQRLADNTLIAPRPISQKFAYEVSSYPKLTMSPELSSLSNTVNLSLPEESNPRLRVLAKNLVEKYQNRPNSQALIIDEVLSKIRQDSFYYTLSPSLLTGDRLDQFFFDTQEGFCVHYASSFTFLMRAAGIPARLVTGYLGGDYHEQGNFYSIYQKDAHAWAEVWLPEKGWTRVDPTAAVSPERVEQGIDAALAQEQSLLNPGFLANARWLDPVTLLRIQAAFELIDYQWTKYIVGFSSKKQSKLLQQLFGEQQYWKVALAVALTLAIIFAVFYLIITLNQEKKTVSVQEKYYRRLQQLIKKEALPTSLQGELDSPSMTVRRYCVLLSLHFSPLEEQLEQFYTTYEALQYQPLTLTQSNEKKAQLLANVKQIAELLKGVRY
ncbi:transglutaminase [Thalassotalea eurytherma]|uniref:Transglutaminase n=2 Tax=Thalassotalea eurytherma TaxID=1144278 RepID=A0ABQ6H547_9GAMM|nr:transglutaminase [Thalassotalea eurytherma]